MRKASGALAYPLIAVCSPAAAHELMERMKPMPSKPGPSTGLQQRWHLGMRHDLFPGQSGGRLAALQNSRLRESACITLFSCAASFMSKVAPSPYLYCAVNTHLPSKLKRLYDWSKASPFQRALLTNSITEEHLHISQLRCFSMS